MRLIDREPTAPSVSLSPFASTDESNQQTLRAWPGARYRMEIIYFCPPDSLVHPVILPFWFSTRTRTLPFFPPFPASKPSFHSAWIIDNHLQLIILYLDGQSSNSTYPTFMIARSTATTPCDIGDSVQQNTQHAPRRYLQQPHSILAFPKRSRRSGLSLPIFCVSALWPPLTPPTLPPPTPVTGSNEGGILASGEFSIPSPASHQDHS
ncbi:hypothetical protein BU24DRAFT_146771 [Aaosphaeria arxii CBS 175.79]|uniref:Uncharacterized protein n=1 Tax=Aaosphaeria arxii CBS 175.79 TaxID=1450172 RepID=A0A6A5XWC4_9PLEO|nr:uncharacterized protein BU24DRAFT_146771 [Aaosphaeria arxii CBS 175.79]KAF2017246.1 hypothetical protein BU24DRAFT_146771 [Aaosphaeria arxii CBS 175.79]